MEVLYPRCAGLDVHAETVVACVRIATGQTVSYEHRTVSTSTGGLLDLSEWLAGHGCTHVAMEAEEVTTSTVGHEGAEPVVAKCEPERPAVTNSLMEAVCERENLKKALRRVKAKKGSPGVDGMTVEQLPDYLRAHWPQHRDELLRGTYTPSPVRRVVECCAFGTLRRVLSGAALERHDANA